MRVENHDFFYYEPEFQGNGDFTDNNVFSPQKRKEYLEHYSDYLRRYYHIPNYSVKVCPEAEAKELDSLVGVPVSLPKVSGRINLTHMDAALLKKCYFHKDWSLYTKKAYIENQELVFEGSPLSPNPNAVYWISEKGRVTEAEIAVYMDKEYYNGISDEKAGENYTHRLITLNAGTDEVVSVMFRPNGDCFAAVKKEDSYRPELNHIGRVEWNSWQTLKISLGKESYAVSFAGGESYQLPLGSFADPDRIFFSSGMLHTGKWKLKLLKLVTEKGEITDFFAPSEATEYEEEQLGEVKLPYSVGNAYNADKMLILRRAFEAEAGAKAILTVGSLDPGGRVYLDEELIAQTDSFEELKIDITEALKKQNKHMLRVEVDPRAPEILYRSHANADPYNGWFSEEITIDIINEVEITDARIITLFAEKKRAKVNFSCKTSKPCRVKLYMAPSWPAKGAELQLGIFDSDGTMSADVDLENVNLWSAETPELYDIRFEVLNDQGLAVDDTVIETGFRTIEQKNGAIYVNGKKTLIKGALNMQFLPPYSETSTTHICPRGWQIVWQYLMLKKMQANTLRLQILGYGTNDARIARLADRVGVMLVWTTRYIDSVEQLQSHGVWRARDGYVRQISLRLNHPSIIIWEGANELKCNLHDIDRIYKEYVNAVKSVDTTRLISPLSNHYYTDPSYRTEACNHYSDDGNSDVFGNPAAAVPEWTDPLIVRTAHTYAWTMGDGSSWEAFREQPWDEQRHLLESKERAYLVTEFAVMGRQDPNTKEARELYFNPFSYELSNEDILGFKLTQEDWRISQAYQALCVAHTVRRYRALDADGMLWSCLFGGANDAGYLKPIIDNYGYAKYAYHVMRENFKTVTCINDTTYVKRGKGFTVNPVLFAAPDETYTVTVAVTDEKGNPIQIKTYGNIECQEYITRLPEWKPELSFEGYYAVKTVVLRLP